MLDIISRIRSNDSGLLMHSIDSAYSNSDAARRLKELNSQNVKVRSLEANQKEIRDLEWELGLYLDEDGLPCLPKRLIAASIQTAAKMSRDGALVRRALAVTRVDFEYNPPGATVDELRNSPDHRFESVVSVQRAKIVRVRPLFRDWGATVYITANPEICGEQSIHEWLKKSGLFIGVGDWRRDKGGDFGGFEILSFEVAGEGTYITMTHEMAEAFHGKS